MAAQEKTSINLLPQKGLESSVAGRVLAWILSSFRIIVIVTEMIVMIAFLSRFWLDAQNSDLSEEIQQKRAVLEASTSFEQSFKEVQNKLTILGELNSFVKPSEIITSLTQSIPPDVIIDTISFADKATTVSGVSPNEISIQQYNVNLATSSLFSTVSVDEVSTNEKNPELFKFTIKLSHKN